MDRVHRFTKKCVCVRLKTTANNNHNNNHHNNHHHNNNNNNNNNNNKQVGHLVMEAAAKSNLKKVTLELGGKVKPSVLPWSFPAFANAFSCGTGTFKKIYICCA